MNRRDFIRAGFQAGLALGAGCASGPRTRVRAPGEKPVLAVIGAGKQARILLHQFLGQDILVKGVCDCDRVRCEDRARVIDDYHAARGVKAPKAVRWHDFREVIADPGVDMVCVATPDHWHAYITVEAMKAGKDVYCEKPLAYSVEESKRVMEAAARYGRVLQTGAMQRSGAEFRTACEIVRNGGIGKVNFVDCNFGGPARPHREPTAAEGAPNPDVDFDMWCGPAPLVAYSDVLSPRGVHDHYPHWRMDELFGLGMCGDWGAHHLDIAQWGLGLDASGPVRVIRSNEPPSRNPLDGGRRQHGLQMIFPDGCTLQHNPFSTWGTVFYGTEGIVAVNRGRLGVWTGKGLMPDERLRKGTVDGTLDALSCVAFWSPPGAPKGQPVPPAAACSARSLLDACNRAAKRFDLRHAKTKLCRSLNHVADFVARVNDRGTPCSPAETGARAAILCQLCSISYVQDTGFAWDPVRNDFAGGTGDAAWLVRPSYRNNWKVVV